MFGVLGIPFPSARGAIKGCCLAQEHVFCGMSTLESNLQPISYHQAPNKASY